MNEGIVIKGEFSKGNLGVLILGVVSFFLMVISLILFDGSLSIAAICFMFIAIVSLISYSKTKNQSLIVTNTIVFGTIAGKTIELPIEKISYVAVEKNVLIIATSGGNITCAGCQNSKEVQNALSVLISNSK